MNQKTAKSIRANMYYPKQRTYFIRPSKNRKTISTTIIANPERWAYQQAKKEYYRNKRNHCG